jgi:iron(III) transport system substrate-binding protein
VLDFTDPKWKGRIGFPPTNASFQAFVSAMRLALGEDGAREWLEGIAANEPKLYEKNLQVVEAVAAGEIEVGLTNHYYLFLLKEEQPDAPVANHYLEAGDVGGLVNVAGVGILEGTDDGEAAERFVEFLLSDEGQRFYSERAEEAEYPLVAGIPPKAGLPALEALQGPDISLGDLGAELEATLELLNEVGLTS